MVDIFKNNTMDCCMEKDLENMNCAKKQVKVAWAKMVAMEILKR